MYAELRDDLVRHYKTTGKREEREYSKRVAHLDEFFARHRAAAITEPEVARYVEFRQGQLVRRAGGVQTPPSNATINRELAVLIKMRRRGHRSRRLVHVPTIEKLEEPAARSGFVTAEEFERVRKNLPADLQTVAYLAYTYGMRLQEILGLDWERHIDFEAREIRLLAGETKNGEGRSLPFTDEAEVLLREQRGRILEQLGRLTECVFPILQGRASWIGTRRLAFVRAWASATKAASVPELLFHDLRRTAVRNLVRAGVSQKVAQEISGHKSATVFARYNITSADDRRDAMKKVAAFQGAR